MVSTLEDDDDCDDFVSTRRLIGAHLIKVWIIIRYFWDALATTVYNPRQLGRGGGGGGEGGGRELIESKYYEGGHCQSVLHSHRFFYIHPQFLEMAPRFNVVMRATGEYTTMCVVRESPDTQLGQLTREELRSLTF